MKRFAASASLVLLFCFAPVAHAAVFTDSQVSSLLGLLTAFGVPQNTINTVHSIIGSNSSGESTFTPGSGQKVTYVSHHSRSASTPTPYHADAVHFDGDTFLSTASLNAPDSDKLTTSIWLRVADDPVDVEPIVWIADPINIYQSFLGYIGSSGTSEANQLNFDVMNTSGTNLLVVNADYSFSHWMNIIFSAETNFSTGNKKYKVYVDGVDATDFIQDTAASSMNFNGLSFYIGTDTFDDDMVGDMADFWFAPGVSLLDGDGDIPEATLRKFIDAQGKPVDLGSHCSAPTGTAPAICMTGDRDDFVANKGTGGSFDLTGALTNADSSPSD